MKQKENIKAKIASTDYPRNLINAVFEGMGIDTAVDINGIPAWLSRLSERERSIVKMRYEGGMTYEQIGKEYNVTGERIRQIDAKALRKLRHPANAKDVKCISLAEHNALMEAKGAELAELRREYRRLRAYTKSLHEAIAKEVPSLTRILTLLPEAPGSENLADIKIEELNLSVRATNCLLRAGLDTAKKVECQSLDQMKAVRNLGLTALNEVRDKLLDYGFDPRF